MSAVQEVANNVQDPVWQVLADAIDGYAIFEVDRAGLIRSWNRGAEQLFGFAAREVTQRPLALLRRPKEAERSDEASVFVRRDGSQFRALTTLRPLSSRAAQHDSTLYIVRELEPAAEDLRRSEERFRLLVEGVSDYELSAVFYAGRRCCGSPRAGAFDRCGEWTLRGRSLSSAQGWHSLLGERRRAPAAR